MRIAFAAPFNILDVHKRSGTPYYMAKAFENAGVHIDYICPLKKKLPQGFKIKRFFKKLVGAQYDSSHRNTYTVKHFSQQVSEKLSGLKVDAVLAHILDPLAYLDSPVPSVIWTDAVYAALCGYNPYVMHHSENTIKETNLLYHEFFSRCKLAIFSSEWAARSAIELYGASKEKVKVVPFGANIDSENSLTDVTHMIKNRRRDVVKLLFIGKNWYHKGGDIVLNVAKQLHQAGQAVELHVVGCQPPQTEIIPSYVKCHGFISKSTPEGLLQFKKLLGDAHFLFVPTRSEAFGLVFCEANAFGVPCLSSYVGGISTIVKDNLNGMTFALDANPEVYCNYIMNLMQNYSRYEEMAFAAFHEYETRLNWKVAVREVKKLIEGIK